MHTGKVHDLFSGSEEIPYSCALLCCIETFRYDHAVPISRSTSQDEMDERVIAQAAVTASQTLHLNPSIVVISVRSTKAWLPVAFSPRLTCTCLTASFDPVATTENIVDAPQDIRDDVTRQSGPTDCRGQATALDTAGMPSHM